MKIKKDDQVKIISGNDRGKQGKVFLVFPKEGKIVVEGINMKKKHVRPRQQGKKGEMIRIPGPFPVSRAQIVCSKCGKPTRIGYKFENKIKLRVCKKCGAQI